MNILFFGDVVGSPAREVIKKWLPRLKKQYKADLTIINGENLAGGSGITVATADEMFTAGVDVITSGNHIWKQADIFPELKKRDCRILRPANYPAVCPGRGELLVTTSQGKHVLIINVQGRTFMDASVDDPFRTMDKILKKYARKKIDAVFVDFHAEATAEKVTLMHYLDGRVSVLVGTHTHVPTADARVTERGTAYVTDVGAVCARDSSIGVEFEAPLYRMMMQMPKSFAVETRGPFWLNAVVVSIDQSRPLPRTGPYGGGFAGRATAIHHLTKIV